MKLVTIRQIIDALTAIEKQGESELMKRGRAVVDARYYNGDDGWERLKEAIGNLEDLVGRSSPL